MLDADGDLLLRHQEAIQVEVRTDSVILWLLFVTGM